MHSEKLIKASVELEAQKYLAPVTEVTLCTGCYNTGYFKTPATLVIRQQLYYETHFRSVVWSFDAFRIASFFSSTLQVGEV